MWRIEFTVNDATYDAVLAQGRKDGNACTRDKGKAAVCRKALHYWLSKQGHPAKVLEMDDDQYAVSGYAEEP